MKNCNKILQDDVINYIKNNLNSHLFSIFCNKMGCVCKTLLPYTKVKWLSWDKILQHNFNLINEVYIFFVKEKHILPSSFIMKIGLKNSVTRLTFFKNLTIWIWVYRERVHLTLSSKIETFKNKLILWHGELNKNNTDMFQCFLECNKENNMDFLLFKNIISRYMIKLGENFMKRFEKVLDNELGCIHDPFLFDIFKFNIPLNEKEQLIDVSSDEILQIQFKYLGCQKC